MADDWRQPLRAILDEAVVIRVRHELDSSQQALLQTLGAGYIVDPRAPVCEKRCGHPECRVTRPSTEASRARLLTNASIDRPAAAFEPNWIDYRASLACVDRRLAAREEVPTCEHCECETDVQPVPHKPGCSAIGAPAVPVTKRDDDRRDKMDGLEALERMDAGETVREAAGTNGAGLAASSTVCKVDGCGEDARDAPKFGPTARLCGGHRAERSARISAERTGRPRGSKVKSGKASPPRVIPPAPAPAPAPPTRTAANESVVSQAERLLACARAVDELQAQLEQARADLKKATEALL